MDVKWIEWITWDLGILMDFHPKDLINMSINGWYKASPNGGVGLPTLLSFPVSNLNLNTRCRSKLGSFVKHCLFHCLHPGSLYLGTRPVSFFA